MEILRRYYEYPVLQEKIRELSGVINILRDEKALLQKQVEQISADRLSDIKSWNSAFELERKLFIEKQEKLESQLLRVFGLTEVENNPVTDRTSNDKPLTTTPNNRPGSRSLSKDEQAELAMLRSLENATDDQLMDMWMRHQGVLDNDLDDPGTLEIDVGTKAR